MDKIESFDDFVKVHGILLAASGLPPKLYPFLFQKLASDTLDGGAYFQIESCDDNRRRRLLLTSQSMSKDSDVFLVDHAWTFRLPDAYKQVPLRGLRDIFIIRRNVFLIMETLWNLLYLLEPAPATLIVTAVMVTFASAFRALNYGKEMERNRDFSEASITLDSSQALMIPVMSSCSLLLMFYLFSSVSQFLTAFTAIASVSSLFFWLSPYAIYIKSQLGLSDPFLSRCCSKSFTRIQGLLLVACAMTVVAWLISGHWVLNNLLGISICIAFVSHVRLPNIKICAMLLVCLFVYDIFWVFFSERFFGANVMVTVATQQASNPVHTVANSLNLPGLQLITKKLELPVKIVFPRNLFGGVVPGVSASDFMMLGLGDMAIPALLLAMVLCFDHRKTRDVVNLFDLKSSKGHKYIWYALPGYATGLVAALAVVVLTHSPQPALLYLVPSTLGPVIFVSWRRKDLAELWEGAALSNPIEKSHEIEI